MIICCSTLELVVNNIESKASGCDVVLDGIQTLMLPLLLQLDVVSKPSGEVQMLSGS
jgi:hypothetical protein